MTELTLMGIGMLATSALIALVIVKVIQSRRGNVYSQMDNISRPIFAGVQQQFKPHYGGAAGYEKL